MQIEVIDDLMVKQEDGARDWKLLGLLKDGQLVEHTMVGEYEIFVYSHKISQHPLANDIGSMFHRKVVYSLIIHKNDTWAILFPIAQYEIDNNVRIKPAKITLTGIHNYSTHLWIFKEKHGILHLDASMEYGGPEELVLNDLVK